MEICGKENCTGCGLCADICPQNAIHMEPGKITGHLVPIIDQEICVDCSLCQKKCPGNSQPKLNLPLKVYAAWQKNAEKQKGSSSGGVAAAFYEKAIESGYYIVGAVLCEDFSTKLIVTNDLADIEKFKNSKYEQASTENVYKTVSEIIKNGGKVLFIGTPCQCEAARKLTPASKADSLITVDLICHGVPSYRLFKDYITWIENMKKKKVTSLSFRTSFGVQLRLFSENQIIWDRKLQGDFFLHGFYKGLISNEACYRCKYACPERGFDITIGDFWGIGKREPFEHPGRKVSIIAIGTHKGESFVEKCSDLVLVERSYEEAVDHNTQLREPASRHDLYKKFWEIYQNKGIESAFRNTVYQEVEAQYRKEHIKEMIKAPIKMIRNAILRRID